MAPPREPQWGAAPEPMEETTREVAQILAAIDEVRGLIR